MRKLLDGVLNGRKEWDKLYSSHVEAFEAQPQPTAPEWLVVLVLGEVEAFQKLWDGNYASGIGDRIGTVAAGDCA